MAYPVSDGSILEVTINGRHNGQTCLSMFHYKLVDTLGLPDGDAAIVAFDGEWNDIVAGFMASWQPAMSVDYTILNVVYQWIWPIRYHRRVFETLASPGQVAGPSLPQNVSVAITKKADRAGRHYIGTLHCPGVPASHVSGGNLQPAAVLLYGAIADNLLTKYRTDTMVPVIYNRTQPVNSAQITGNAVQNTSRVERRRTVGLGV